MNNSLMPQPISQATLPHSSSRQVKNRLMKFPAKLLRTYHLAIHAHIAPVVVFRDTQSDTPPNAIRLEYDLEWVAKPEAPAAIAEYARTWIDHMRSLPEEIANLEASGAAVFDTTITRLNQEKIAQLKQAYAAGVQPIVVPEKVSATEYEKLPS